MGNNSIILPTIIIYRENYIIPTLSIRYRILNTFLNVFSTFSHVISTFSNVLCTLLKCEYTSKVKIFHRYIAHLLLTAV